MKKIKLTHNTFALVDNKNFEYLNQFKWHFDKSTGYACRTLYPKGKVYMHRFINNTPKDMATDHINRDKLDNRQKNLRNADKRLNGINRGVERSNKSGYKNIYYRKSRQSWIVSVEYAGKRVTKQFKDLNEAIERSYGIRKEVYGL